MATPLPQELNEQIVIKNVSGSVNATTGVRTASSTYATVWARITEEGGEVDITDQESLAQSQRYEIWTQYDSGITGFMQITWGSKTLVMTDAPQKITDRFNRHWTVIQAQEVTEEDLA